MSVTNKHAGAGLSNQELLRYSRHLLLPECGEQGQLALRNAHILLIGCGGLGCAAAQYLVAAGVGALTLVDGDKVELSNLQRPILFRTADIGANKAIAAKRALTGLNPHVTLHAKTEFFTEHNADALLSAFSAEHRQATNAATTKKPYWVLDCSDNFACRRLVNLRCKQHQLTLISGAAIGMKGQLSLWPFAQADGPCYQCVFGEPGDSAGNCASLGVLSALPGVIGTLLANLLLNDILNPAQHSRFWQFDGTSCTLKPFQFAASASCELCAR